MLVCVRAGGEGECLHACVCSCGRRGGVFTCSCVFVQEESGSVYMLVCVRAGGEGECLHARVCSCRRRGGAFTCLCVRAGGKEEQACLVRWAHIL